MTMTITYSDAAHAYADGVRDLFAPGGAAGLRERGTAGPASYDDLSAKAEKLSPLAADLNVITARQLTDPDNAIRAAAEIRLLAKALTDLDISEYLLDAARDQELDIDYKDGGMVERAVASTATIEEQLCLLLDPPGAGRPMTERGVMDFHDLPTARSELVFSIEDNLFLISDRAGTGVSAALTGLAGLGLARAAQAAGALGAGIVDVLGRHPQVAVLYGQVQEFAVHSYEALCSLLGADTAQRVGAQVMKWLEDFDVGAPATTMVRALYEIEWAKQEMDALVATSDVELARYAATIGAIDDLESAFSRRTSLVNRVLPKLRFLGLLPPAQLPSGTLLLAAAYIVLAGYVVLTGADYVDARKLTRLDRVSGIRTTVGRNLTVGKVEMTDGGADTNTDRSLSGVAAVGHRDTG